MKNASFFVLNVDFLMFYCYNKLKNVQ